MNDLKTSVRFAYWLVVLGFQGLKYIENFIILFSGFLVMSSMSFIRVLIGF